MWLLISSPGIRVIQPPAQLLKIFDGSHTQFRAPIDPDPGRLKHVSKKANPVDLEGKTKDAIRARTNSENNIGFN